MKQDFSTCTHETRTRASEKSLGALIAGEGLLPLLVARHASRSGYPLLVYSLDDFSVYAGLERVEVVPLSGGLDLRAMIGDMLRRGVSTVTLAGMVPKRMMYAASLDPSLSALLEVSGNDDHSLLGRIVAAFESAGLRVVPYSSYLTEYLAPEGIIAGRAPSEAESSDIAYGCGILSVTLPLSFGQALVVAGGAVVAIEAMEGTDAMIERAGELLASAGGSGGGVVVKMMRADQDERYDIPVVGVSTLETMHAAGLTCLAVESKRTLLLEPEKFRERAVHLGIAVRGISGGSKPLTRGSRS